MSNVIGSPDDPVQCSHPNALSREITPFSLGLGIHFHPVPRCWWNCQLSTVRVSTSTEKRQHRKHIGNTWMYDCKNLEITTTSSCQHLSSEISHRHFSSSQIWAFSSAWMWGWSWLPRLEGQWSQISQLLQRQTDWYFYHFHCPWARLLLTGKHLSGTKRQLIWQIFPLVHHLWKVHLITLALSSVANTVYKYIRVDFGSTPTCMHMYIEVHAFATEQKYFSPLNSTVVTTWFFLNSTSRQGCVSTTGEAGLQNLIGSK